MIKQNTKVISLMKCFGLAMVLTLSATGASAYSSHGGNNHSYDKNQHDNDRHDNDHQLGGGLNCPESSTFCHEFEEEKDIKDCPEDEPKFDPKKDCPDDEIVDNHHDRDWNDEDDGDHHGGHHGGHHDGGKDCDDDVEVPEPATLGLLGLGLIGLAATRRRLI